MPASPIKPWRDSCDIQSGSQWWIGSNRATEERPSGCCGRPATDGAGGAAPETFPHKRHRPQRPIIAAKSAMKKPSTTMQPSFNVKYTHTHTHTPRIHCRFINPSGGNPTPINGVGICSGSRAMGNVAPDSMDWRPISYQITWSINHLILQSGANLPNKHV